MGFGGDGQDFFGPFLRPVEDGAGGLRNDRVVLENRDGVIMRGVRAGFGHRALDGVVIPVGVQDGGFVFEEVAALVLFGPVGMEVRIGEAVGRVHISRADMERLVNVAHEMGQQEQGGPLVKIVRVGGRSARLLQDLDALFHDVHDVVRVGAFGAVLVLLFLDGDICEVVLMVFRIVLHVVAHLLIEVGALDAIGPSGGVCERAVVKQGAYVRLGRGAVKQFIRNGADGFVSLAAVGRRRGRQQGVGEDYEAGRETERECFHGMLKCF